MTSVDSFAINVPLEPPVSELPLEAGDSGIMDPLFADGLLSAFSSATYPTQQDDSAHSSPAGYSPSHAVPSPLMTEATLVSTEGSSDELVHARSSIIDKLPSKKRNASTPDALRVKIEDESAGSGGADDDRGQKRLRRLMKNRESAQASRLRKKAYVEELEKKVELLQRANEELTKKNAHLTQLLKQAQARPLTTSKSAKAAGVCLLVLLFSFGIIFNSTQRLPFDDSLGSLRARHIGRQLASTDMKQRTTKDDEEMSTVVSTPVVAAPVHMDMHTDDASMKGSLPNLGSMAERASKLSMLVDVSGKERRTVFGGDAKDRASAHLSVDSFDPAATLQDQKRRKTNLKVLPDIRQQQQQRQESDSPAMVIQPIVHEDDEQLVPMKDVVRSTNLVPLSEAHRVSLPIGVSTRTRPVTQWFFCPEAHRLPQMIDGEAVTDSPPNYVSLLIPGEMLNSTFAPPNSLVEVTCSVSSMNYYPNYRSPLPEQAEDVAPLQRT